MFVGAHPDDVEICCGGSIAKLVAQGCNCAIVDLTSGQLGTRGTPEIRLEEAEEAAKILGISHRVNLGIMDGSVVDGEENQIKIIEQIRRFQPKIVVSHPPFERHPDHENANKLLRTSIFKSGLRKIETQFKGERQQPHRPKRMFCYMQSYEFPRKPDFCLDISDFFEKKLEAVFAHRSQVLAPGENPSGPQTKLYNNQFANIIEARARHFGALCGVKYAEPFLAVETVLLEDLSVFL